MAKSEGVSNISSVTICQKYFFRILSQKNAQIVNLKKSGFGFDPKNPPWVWILWIHDPFLDLPQKTWNPFLDSEIRIGIFPKVRTLSVDIFI